MKIWHGLLLIVIVAAVGMIACSNGPEPFVEPDPVLDETSLRTVAQGDLVGYTHFENEVHVWRSVPYAAPPIGDLRWRAPRPAASWTDTRESLDPAPWCVQVKGQLDDSNPDLEGVEVGSAVGQEDCLYINIYAPKMGAEDAANAKLPVMMWIHGGSNVWGRAAQYDPSDFVENEQVIVAVMQYRLGPLGWFAHPTIREAAETADDGSANFAILDQIAALDWLGANVAAFGGDPNNITIFGESAGGHDVATLLGSPRAAGTFHRAIIQSGSFRSETLEDAENKTNQASKPIVSELFPNAETVSADDLRGVPVNVLFGAYMSDARDGLEPPRIIEDGIVVPLGGLREAFNSTDTFNAVPIMSGTNKDEVKFFNVFVDELVKWRFGALPKARDLDEYNAVNDAQSRMWRYGAVDQPFEAMIAAGHTDLYGYRFDWDEEGSVWGSNFADLFGAAHSFEIPFVFGQFRFLGSADRWVFTKKNEADRIGLSKRMQAYWGEFAYSGDPANGSSDDEAEWSAWTLDANTPNIMIFDTDGDGTTRMIADLESGERIRNDLFADTRLPNLEYKCRLHLATQYWDPAHEPTAGGRCSSDAASALAAE